MKRLLLSTAILAASALGASAQDMFRGEPAPDEIRASDLMGMRVYASASAVDANEASGPQEGWEDIGEINDIVLGRDGSVQAVLVDVGGFLGIGERQVAVSMGSLRFVSDSATPDDLNDYFLVVNADRAAIEGAPDYNAAMSGAAAASADQAQAVEESSAEAAAAGTQPTDQAVTETAGEGTGAEASGDAAMTEAEAEAQDTANAATDASAAADTASTDAASPDTAATTASADATSGDTAAATGRTPVSREGYSPLGAEMMTADRLQGAAVYDANDDRVGEVGEILIDDQGAVTDLVIDVGGFLGIGEKPVALPLDSVDILQQDGGEDLRVYVSQTKEQLEAQETYENQ